jgi:uncharacterized membrane protein YgdD (TMEM256/DUF423 family)
VRKIVIKIVLSIAAFSAMLSVVLGAFAAHGLKSKLSENLLNTFQTGVQYQMYHSLALILLFCIAKCPNHCWYTAQVLCLRVLFCLAAVCICWRSPKLNGLALPPPSAVPVLLLAGFY